jgi:hypothetical protein
LQKVISSNISRRAKPKLLNEEAIAPLLITWHLGVRITNLLGITLKTEITVELARKKEPSLLKVIKAKHRSKFAALHRQW